AADNQDRTATGRQSSACRGCHYEGPFALDLLAKTLTRRKGTGDQMTFVPPSEGPQNVLDTTASSDEEVVTALVESESFKFNVCRLAFQFLYGRPENACESKTFDSCIEKFTNQGTMRSAVAAIVKDKSFCD